MSDRMILLVEDNPGDEALTLRTLKRNSIFHEVIVAHDGAEALDFVFGNGSYAGRDTKIMPELILLDLRLPKVDGLEVLQRLRADELTKEIPVVVLTSSDAEIDLIQSYKLGANCYLRKAARQLGVGWLVSSNLSANNNGKDDHKN